MDMRHLITLLETTVTPMIDTPEFRAWFGNSKVVDASGQPLRVYHGTTKEFDTFKLPGLQRSGGKAIFLATNPADASYFARSTGKVIPCYVRMENPFDHNDPLHIEKLSSFIEKNFKTIFPGALFGPSLALDELARGDFSVLEKPAVRAWMRRNKFDGFWTRENSWSSPTIGVFDPHQIKSALTNTGRYTRDHPSIVEQVSPSRPEDILKVYRGETANNRNGSFWTEDMEFAQQFTQSGLAREVMMRYLRAKDVFVPPLPVYAGNEDGVDAAIAEAGVQGCRAVQLSEGRGEPDSIFVFDKAALRRNRPA